MERTVPLLADGDLVERCVRGDRAAWDHFVERFSGLVYFSICHLLRAKGASVPADLLGEVHNAVFLSLLEDDCCRLRRFSGRCKLSHWLKVVSVNRTIDFPRKQRPDRPLDDPEGEGLATVGAVYTRKNRLRKRLAKILHRSHNGDLRLAASGGG